MRSAILRHAEELINGDRQEEYGSPAENFGLIADHWSTYLGVAVQPHDVANMMALLKIARTRQGYKSDSYVDGAGYIGLAAELHEGGL